MGDGRPGRNPSSMDEVDKDETDLQVAINESNRRKDASFKICLGKSGTSFIFQQSIPRDFIRNHRRLLTKNVMLTKNVTLEGPTGQTWTTVIRPCYRDVRFCKGWRQFSTENHLQEGHHLLFTLVGSFRFLVQFFDHLGERCPLPKAQEFEESVPLAEAPDLQTGLQQVADGGRQVSQRHGSEADTSAAPFVVSTAPSAGPLNSDQDKAILRQFGPESPPEPRLPREHMREMEGRSQHAFDTRNGSEDMDIADERNSAICNAPIYIISDTSSDDEPPDRVHLHFSEMREGPVSRKLRPPVAPPVVASFHEAGGSESTSSRAVSLLQQQRCTQFSDLLVSCERRSVSDRERGAVVEAAKRFVSALASEKFMVVMRPDQVYHWFHLAIPENILHATGTERASKVEVCLVDQEQAMYKAHWTRRTLRDTALLNPNAWAKFAVDHSVEEGDVCVFQLLHSKPAASTSEFCFSVHIFRTVETYDSRGAPSILRWIRRRRFHPVIRPAPHEAGPQP